MKVRCSFTVEFDPDEYREAFSIADEHMSAEEIRKEVQGRASESVVMELADEGVEVSVRHHHLK